MDNVFVEHSRSSTACTLLELTMSALDLTKTVSISDYT